MHGELPKRTLSDSAANPRARRGRRWLATLLVLAAVGGTLAYVYWSAQPTQPQSSRARFGPPPGPVPVLAATVIRADVPVFLDAVGTVSALNTVTVRPQADGRLIEVTFREGQDVQKGDVLARIDPTLYRAQLDQALAKKAQDEALLANARADLERYSRLAASNAINRQQVDTQRALVAQYEAQVKADEAAIDTARATLGYTTVTAPISGRTGLRLVDEGNYVRAADAGSALVVITQLQPIAVVFNLPQQDLLRVTKAFAGGPLTVDAIRSDNNEVLATGKLTVIDNQVDPATGTVRLKAEFSNPDLQLWPGQFVNVRLYIDTLRQVATIPTGAVQRGPDGTFVYVIGDDNKAGVRKIDVGMQDELRSVITRGLAPGERVVTTGFARLEDGAQVSVGRANDEPPAELQRGGAEGSASGQARAEGAAAVGQHAPSRDGARARGERTRPPRP